MNCLRTTRLIAAVVILGTTIAGCSLSVPLRTETANPKSISGNFDLYVYGCRYPDDIERAAFLIAPDKASMVELYVLDTSYKVKRGIPADKAIEEANAHVRCGILTVDEIRTHRIPDNSGGTLGYEILPRFPATERGGPDPLLVNYSFKNGKFFVYIQIDPMVKRQLADVPGQATSGSGP